jgi:hypothetical protein
MREISQTRSGGFTYGEAEKFVAWLLSRVVADARGDGVTSLDVAPTGRVWLGRVAPEERTAKSLLGDRGERMDPCEIGFRVRPTALDGRVLNCTVSFCGWYESQGKWQKTPAAQARFSVPLVSLAARRERAGADAIVAAAESVGVKALKAEVRVELEGSADAPDVVVTLVNTSPDTVKGLDTNLYEAALSVEMGPTVPYRLEALPESFRFSREVEAYGINGGVQRIGDSFVTTDVIEQSQPRPEYWDATTGPTPDLSFHTLGSDPLPSLSVLEHAMGAWADQFWGNAELNRRAQAEQWSSQMTEEAQRGSEAFDNERARLRRGLELLRNDAEFCRAFRLMNLSFERAVTTYKGWRPFQIGFLLTSLASIHSTTRVEESNWVDTLWFATGGGKTETYLGLLVMAAFLDRLRKKVVGITAWTRFPLRMLSLQQTQRFADIFAAAELVRDEEKIKGAPFSVGFLVGPATPNRISPDPQQGETNFRDPNMPKQYRVLLTCPFCRAPDLRVGFSKERWRLYHYCGAENCPWGKRALPFYVVDEEIYRFLPTVVVGTLDKAANLGMQSSMRCFYAAPMGECPEEGHGFTYMRRGKSPYGCLFPECSAKPNNLPQSKELFAPTIRLQDELHLLRDALGAVDSHYEALLDHLQGSHGTRSKVLASSATLHGFEQQASALYQRTGRVFPQPGPYTARSFWRVDSQRLMRVFSGVAPRGVTIEFASDRTTEALQRAIREALDHPSVVARQAGVSLESIDSLVCYYGVDVIYGSTIRDVEAASRSFDVQIRLDPLHHIRLTGHTPFEEVIGALDRLATDCERPFAERLHLIAASSMLSHGVDVERLNVMVMLGLPLSTAEFIQTTSRVGRRYPALVMVLHKISRERDASVFRSFRPFIQHADRLIDPVPITRRSRRVLDQTFAGLFQGRLLGIHEERALQAGLKPLTTLASIRRAFQRLSILESAERDAMIEMLGLTSDLDEKLRGDVGELMRQTFRAINDPAGTAMFLSDVLPNGAPMRSLRDVEEQAPVYTKGGAL